MKISNRNRYIRSAGTAKESSNGDGGNGILLYTEEFSLTDSYEIINIDSQGNTTLVANETTPFKGEPLAAIFGSENGINDGVYSVGEDVTLISPGVVQIKLPEVQSGLAEFGTLHLTKEVTINHDLNEDDIIYRIEQLYSGRTIIVEDDDATSNDILILKPERPYPGQHRISIFGVIESVPANDTIKTYFEEFELTQGYDIIEIVNENTLKVAASSIDPFIGNGINEPFAAIDGSEGGVNDKLFNVDGATLTAPNEVELNLSDELNQTLSENGDLHMAVSYNVTHNLNDEDLIYRLEHKPTGETLELADNVTDNNVIVFNPSIPRPGTHRISVFSFKKDASVVIQPQGLFSRPFILEVTNGSVPSSETKDVIIKGFNFEKETEVVIPEPSITVNQVTLTDPTELVVNVTAGATTGDFDILLKNNLLDSGSTGNGLLKVRDVIFVDLRTALISELGLVFTPGIIINQDPAYGLWASGTGNIWDRGVLFTAHQWVREENVEFSFVFTRTGFATMMFGIGGSNIDVNVLNNSSFYAAETQMYHNTDHTSQFYGGGIQSAWVQSIGATINFDIGKFYKVKFHRNGEPGTTMSIHEVDSGDMDTELNTLHTWLSTSPAADPLLMPFWAAVNTPDIFITAYKIL